MKPLWITEAEVVDLLDLTQAIDALESALRMQAAGTAQTMSKTHSTWGAGHVLHAIGAASEGMDLVGAKSWAHTRHGATPLLLLWSAADGTLEAVIEAFALGQMRTGAVSGVATRYMAGADASVLALVGAGEQALAQVAAIAAVRRLETVRVFSRSTEKRDSCAARVAELLPDITVVRAASVAQAAEGASIVTLVTRADRAFFKAQLAAPGAHINAVGAITPEREEFAQDVFDRAGWLAADDLPALFKLSREFATRFGPQGKLAPVEQLCDIVAAGRGRAPACDLSLFKAMGMGLSDLGLGAEVLKRARAAGAGRILEHPKRVTPRLAPHPVSRGALP